MASDDWDGFEELRPFPLRPPPRGLIRRVELVAEEDPKTGDLRLSMRGSTIVSRELTFSRYVRDESPFARLEALANGAEELAATWRRQVEEAKAIALTAANNMRIAIAVAQLRERRLELLWRSTWLEAWREIGAAAFAGCRVCVHRHLG
jgi:hypothetical protein